MNESGLYDVFAETNGVQTENREATCQHGSKCIDYVLDAEGMLRKVTECELIECSEIVESDHKWCLTGIDFVEYFGEEFVERDVSHERSLNPKRKSHREKFAEKCKQMLGIINIEKELQEENGNFSREKIEQLDDDITHVLRKARKTRRR